MSKPNKTTVAAQGARNFIHAVDERTQLAGTNRLEVLLFTLGQELGSDRKPEIYGINVFKVREVILSPQITRAPDTPPSVLGIVALRGTIVPVVDLAKFCNMSTAEPPRVLLVTEYNRSTLGLLVHAVEHIMRMEWNQIRVPPAMLTHSRGGLVTAVTEMEDGRIMMLLDVEKILVENSDFGSDPNLFENLLPVEGQKTILFADDSSVARKQIQKTLETLGLHFISAKNGREAWDRLEELHERAELGRIPLSELVAAVLTDVEMPEMDGYVLTKLIKNDSRFSQLPVIMHSSLSASANVTIGKSVGADIYIAKFHPKDLSDALRGLLKLQNRKTK
ncbi:MAG: chemotaxis protein [Gammaproteobacteria bacterium]|nr:chemotaxis protein [Gammaproteobacteria bacterium]